MAADQGGVEARARVALDRLAGDLPGLGIALSGGGDSIALLHLIAWWRGDRRVAAVTVDHGLRPESAEEAAGAGRAAAALGIEHRTLRWSGPAPLGNLAAQARQARLSLIGTWAREQGLPAIALGHTRDDVAETLLMRLGRGAGIDGLAAMAERREAEGVVWLRPLLGLGRQELRDYLTARGAGWVDDPTNDDLRRDRARIRAAIAALGLDPARLAESAAHLAGAREALVPEITRAAGQAIMSPDGQMAVSQDKFDRAPREIRRLILVAAVSAVTGQEYPPRRAALLNALDALESGQRVTLAGTLIMASRGSLTVGREPAAAARARPLTADGVWDNRWAVTGLPEGQHVAAVAGMAWPALWRDQFMIAPLPFRDVKARLIRHTADFRRKLGIPMESDSESH